MNFISSSASELSSRPSPGESLALRRVVRWSSRSCWPGTPSYRTSGIHAPSLGQANPCRHTSSQSRSWTIHRDRCRTCQFQDRSCEPCPDVPKYLPLLPSWSTAYRACVYRGRSSHWLRTTDRRRESPARYRPPRRSGSSSASSNSSTPSCDRRYPSGFASRSPDLITHYRCRH